MQAISYLDFEVTISKGDGGQKYLVEVKSQAGETPEPVPMGDLAFQDALLPKFQNSLRSLDPRQVRLTPDERISREEPEVVARDFGQQLFGALMVPRVVKHYNEFCGFAEREGQRPRLKLCLPAELAALPWEFLRDPGQPDYLCLSDKVSIVRYLRVGEPKGQLGLKEKEALRILCVAASPSRLGPVDIDGEKQRMKDAEARGELKDKVTLSWLEGAVSIEKLQDSLRDYQPHIIHFIGHGGFDKQAGEGLIALANEDGSVCWMPATMLARALAGQPSLRLVVLNSCEGAVGSEGDVFSSTASRLVEVGIPAVIAMQYPITNDAAVSFASSFYGALADGSPVDAAMADARVAMSDNKSLEWGTPVLYMRTENGDLFPERRGRNRMQVAWRRYALPAAGLALLAGLGVLLYNLVVKPPLLQNVWFEPVPPRDGQPVIVHWTARAADWIELRPFGTRVPAGQEQVVIPKLLPEYRGLKVVAGNAFGSTTQELPIAPCDLLPVGGFGRVYSKHPEVAAQLGCVATDVQAAGHKAGEEVGMHKAAVQKFEHGLMLWVENDRPGAANVVYALAETGPDSGDYQRFVNPSLPVPGRAGKIDAGFSEIGSQFATAYWEFTGAGLGQRLGRATDVQKNIGTGAPDEWVAAYQWFVNGRMLWVGQLNRIFVFQGSGNSGAWASFVDPPGQ